MHEISDARQDRKTLTHFHSIDPPFGSSWTHVQVKERTRKKEREYVCVEGGWKQQGNNARPVIKQMFKSI